MFKIDMHALRKTANDLLLIANAANPANETGFEVSKLATLAALAISNGGDSLNADSPNPNSWRPLFIAYDVHASTCPTCIAGGLGYGLRCGTGTALWAAYQNH